MYLQQGDTLYFPINKLPKETKELKTNVIQEGESTGHAHRLHGDGFRILHDKHDERRKFISLVKPTMLKHEEHEAFLIPAGEYEVKIVREWDHFKEEARAVVD
jgi:hypothetical protein